MNKIIVPTDFSPTAAAAFRYAYTLAKTTGFNLEVLHVHDGYGHIAESKAEKGSLEACVAVQRSIDQFIRFANVSTPVSSITEPEDEEVRISSRDVIGTPTEALLAASKDTDTRLIVMGGVGTGVVSTVTPMFGSIARSVTEQADCPVLLVPKNYEPKAIDRVSLAFNTADELRQISHGFDFLRVPLHPAMRLAHVRDFNEKIEANKELALLQDKLENGFPEYPVDLDLLQPGTTAFKLLEYADEESIDLLVMGRRKKNFLQRLFTSSQATPVLEFGSIPMLFVPVGS